MVAAERTASLGWRWIGAGEVVWQCGHGQGPKDEETSRHNEGGNVVACNVSQEPWRGEKKPQVFSADACQSRRSLLKAFEQCESILKNPASCDVMRKYDILHVNGWF